jgi:tight adherence protein C
MMPHLVSPLSMAPPLMMPLGALLVVTGIGLLAYALQADDDALARHVDLVRPPATGVTTPKKQAQALEKGSVRRSMRGRPESEQREIIRLLLKLRISPRYASFCFIASRILAAAGLGLLTFTLLGHVTALSNLGFAIPVVAVGAAILGSLLPPTVIQVSARRRAKAVAAALPEALDLLVVCVDAGLSLEDSLTRIVTELRQSQPALTDELALTSADLQILPSRDEAFARLADRIDLPSVRSVVTTLAQTLRYGTALAQGLRVIAAEMRNDALVQLEEQANRLPALMTVPMMIFIVPTIFLVVGGPAALRLIDAFGR